MQIDMAPASEGKVAFNLMVEQATVPGDLVMCKPVMLVAAQLLLDRVADCSAERFRIAAGVHGANEGCDVFSAVQGRGRRHVTLLMPSIHRFYKTSILGVLRTTGATARQTRMNGMAGKGTQQVVHWGDSGTCQLRWSRAMVERFLNSPRFDAMTDQAKHDTAATYGETANLVVEGEKMALPPLQQCEKVWRALHGEQVVVTDAELDLIEPVLCAGLHLVSAPNPLRVGILDAYVLQRPPASPH